MTNRRRIIPWLIVVEAVALVQLAIWTGERIPIFFLQQQKVKT